MQNRGFYTRIKKSAPHKSFCTPYINLIYAHFACRSAAFCIKLPVYPLFSHFFKICGRLAKNPTVWWLFGTFSAFLCHLSPKRGFWRLFPSVHSDFRRFGQFCLCLPSFWLFCGSFANSKVFTAFRHYLGHFSPFAGCLRHFWRSLSYLLAFATVYSKPCPFRRHLCSLQPISRLFRGFSPVDSRLPSFWSAFVYFAALHRSSASFTPIPPLFATSRPHFTQNTAFEPLRAVLSRFEASSREFTHISPNSRSNPALRAKIEASPCPHALFCLFRDIICCFLSQFACPVHSALSTRFSPTF